MNILCPTDFSKTSLVALEYAVKIGEKHNANLHLLYAFTEEEYNKKLNTTTVLTYDEYKAEAEQKLEGIANEIRNRKRGCKVSYNVVAGAFLEAAKNTVAEQNIDLVVIGTKGANDVMEKMAGTNTIRIIENIATPVLAVPKNANYEHITNVVYGSDYNKEDRRCIQTMVDILQPFGPKFTVLHMSAEKNETSISQYEEFKSWVRENTDAPLHFELKTYEDSVALGIDEYMLENESKLLCIYMEKQNLFDRIFHKSITLQLTYLMDFPLLIIK